MPGYAKFMKDLVTKKSIVSFEDDDWLQHYSTIATRSLMQKKEDPSAFTIPCTIGLLHFSKALYDLGASINLMPLSIYKKMGLGAPKWTAMQLLMADETVPIILERPFLAIGRVLVYMEKGQMKFRLNSSDVSIEEWMGVDALAAVMMNFEGDCIEDYDELVAALDRFEFHSKSKRLELHMKNRDSPPVKPSIKEAPKLELKALPSHLRYVSLGRDGTLPVIIAADLNVEQFEALVSVLKRFKQTIGWTIVDIIGIPPGICSHKIKLMPYHKPSIKH
ncbi:hypothetical protein R3W88_031864 [Solanum pinnatisectum]|uniref:Uncharacterized protein n=1 Tax=Solanum pinnatisectum TaxID=50273 RepID=A0AAV9LNX0_9SOLN|nr:hypothetical protein R3W88_031864 [Solanum pinnatisectum]